ncbi:MAG: hypothetical protein J5698_07315 [Bacteroidaceae bacterium]|nr:hypothetical protein [Bacteroidaceae bacterium]
MKKTVLLLVCFFCATFAYAQEKDTTDVKLDYYASLGAGRYITPQFVDDLGKTYGQGMFSTNITASMLYPIPKTVFAIGVSGLYQSSAFPLDKQARASCDRWMIGPAIAIKKTFLEKNTVSLMATAGLRVDGRMKNLPSTYHYCQDKTGFMSGLSASYLYHFKNVFSEGIGIKGSVYSYGNSPDMNVRDPFIDSWEVSLYFDWNINLKIVR